MKKVTLFGLLGVIFLLGGYKQNVVRAKKQASKALATGASNSTVTVLEVQTKSGITVLDCATVMPVRIPFRLLASSAVARFAASK